MNKSFKKHLTNGVQRIRYVITNDKHLGMSLMQVINCAPKLKKPNVINLSGCLDEYSTDTIANFSSQCWTPLFKLKRNRLWKN